MQTLLAIRQLLNIMQIIVADISQHFVPFHHSLLPKYLREIHLSSIARTLEYLRGVENVLTIVPWVQTLVIVISVANEMTVIISSLVGI